MVKYTSNTYYLIDSIFFQIIFIGIIGFIVYSLRSKAILLFSGGTIIFVLLVILVISLLKLGTIKFTESNIVLEYFFNPIIGEINYSDILEFHYIFGYKWGSKNIIKYKSSNSKIKKLKLSSVTSLDEYREFAEWIRDKNNNIAFKFFPPEKHLIDRYNLNID